MPGRNLFKFKGCPKGLEPLSRKKLLIETILYRQKFSCFFCSRIKPKLSLFQYFNFIGNIHHACLYNGSRTNKRKCEDLFFLCDDCIEKSAHKKQNKKYQIHFQIDLNLSKKDLLLQQDSCCFYCKTKLEYDQCTIDHKIPRSKGGSSFHFNKVICCNYCNNLKGNLDYKKWELILKYMLEYGYNGVNWKEKRKIFNKAIEKLSNARIY